MAPGRRAHAIALSTWAACASTAAPAPASGSATPDGTPYGEPLRPETAEQAEQAFAALRGLSFGHARARALVDAVAQAGGADDLEGLVRAALQAS